MTGRLEDFLARIKADRQLFSGNEEATKQGVVLPVLARLGWDRDDVREVVPEFTVGTRRVDYCLKVLDRPEVFLEVKNSSETLDAHQKQLLEYAFEQGVKIAVLSNGMVWWFYLPLSQGSWEERKFFAVDILQQAPDAAAAHLADYLGKESVSQGLAVKRAEEIQAGKEKDRRIKEAMPQAWRQICETPDKLLLDLIAEKVEGICGYRPTVEAVTRFVATRHIFVPPAPPPVALPAANASKQGPRVDATVSAQTVLTLSDAWAYRKPVAYVFRGERRKVATFKDVLVGVAAAINGEHPDFLERVLAVRGRGTPQYATDGSGMREPRNITGTPYFAETHMGADAIRERLSRLLKQFGYPADSLQLEA